MSDVPDQIGLIGDGFGMWALAHRDEAVASIHYLRADVATRQLAEAQAEIERLTISEDVSRASIDTLKCTYNQIFDAMQGEQDARRKAEAELAALKGAMPTITTAPGWTKTADSLPKKPGLSHYEQIECLIMMPNHDIEVAMWNCEHLVWDDAEGDDYRCDPTTPTHWLDLSAIRAALPLPPEEQEG